MAVSDPLADYTGEKVIGTLLVCHLPLVIAEIELRQIAVKMPLEAMLVHAFHAPLKDAEIAFNHVRLDFTAIEALHRKNSRQTADNAVQALAETTPSKRWKIIYSPRIGNPPPPLTRPR